VDSLLVSIAPISDLTADVDFPAPSFFFFGGLSIHITVAILAHMFSYNITWGATKKVSILSLLGSHHSEVIIAPHYRKSSVPTSGKKSPRF
jgi:hypothetical protein